MIIMPFAQEAGKRRCRVGINPFSPCPSGASLTARSRCFRLGLPVVRRCLEHFQQQWNRDACLKLRHALKPQYVGTSPGENPYSARTHQNRCVSVLRIGGLCLPTSRKMAPAPTRPGALRLVRSYHRAPAVVVVNLGGDVAVAIPVPVDCVLRDRRGVILPGWGRPADARPATGRPCLAIQQPTYHGRGPDRADGTTPKSDRRGGPNECRQQRLRSLPRR